MLIFQFLIKNIFTVGLLWIFKFHLNYLKRKWDASPKMVLNRNINLLVT